MRPILFDKSTTNFTTNGIGRLECISCHVIEERNGMYELEAVVPITGEHTADVGMESIIGAIPNDGGTLQAFRVYKVGKPINGKFSVYARHISYLLSDIPTMPFTVSFSPSACANTLAGLKSNAIESCPFNFYTDVTTAALYKQSAPASIRERLGGVEGSVLDQFGGEYEWDNFDVHLWKQRGRLANVTGITLRYGKNITDINQEEAISNTVTGVVPYWVDTEGNNLVTLPEKVIYSPHSTEFAYHLTQVLDLSSNFEEQPTVSQLRTYANTYVNKSGFGVPKVSIKVSFVNLWETEEYKDIAPLERVKLCDEINVEFEKLGITAVAKVVKTDYDVLKERYISIEVGSVRSTLAQAVTDREKEVDSAFLNQLTRVGQQIADATAWLTSANGYVVAVKNTDGSWKELLFMDTNDPSTARNVLRINNNGIGFSTNGINGPYSTAWTIDGRLGDAANKNYWNFLTGDFRLSATAGINVNADEANYTGAYVPTNSNIPAVNWTADQKKQHVGETFRDVSSGGKTYIYKTTPMSFETAHPYREAVTHEYYHLTVPSNYGGFLQFDSHSAIENNWDNLYIYVKAYDGFIYKGTFTGTIGEGYFTIDAYGGSSYEVWLEWVTDGSGVAWGWKLTPANSGSGTNFSNKFNWGTPVSLPSATWTNITWGDGFCEWVEATVEDYVGAKAESSQPDLTQEEIYDILTNGGETQGIFLSDIDNKLYINGQYFTSNAITIGGANYNEKPYLEIRNNDTSSDPKGAIIGRWDVDGIMANAGKFGKLHVFTDSSNNQTYLRYVTAKSYQYVNDSWSRMRNSVSGSITINPYKEGWTTDGYINFNFFRDITSTTSQCRVSVYQYTSGSRSLIRTVNLRATGYSSEGVKGLEYSDCIFNRTFGQNDGDYYRIQYLIYSYSGSVSTTLEVNDGGKGASFIIRENGNAEATCIGKFMGEFKGAGLLDTLSVGKYVDCIDGEYRTSTHDGSSTYGVSVNYDGVRVWHGTEDWGDSDDKLELFYYDISREEGGTDYYLSWQTSDERAKEEIEDLDSDLSKRFIDSIRTRKFKYKGAEGKHYGVIAQETREILDNLGEEDSQLEYIAGRPDGKIPNQRSVHYEEFVPHLINYVKDLRSEIESLKEEIAKLKNT